MKISPSDAVNIAMKYNKLKDKTVEELKEEINKIDIKVSKKSKKFIIIILIFIILISIILLIMLNLFK